MSDESERAGKGLMDGLIEALNDKHGELNIQIRSVSLRFPGANLGVEVSGEITLSTHLRALAPEEKEAHVAHNVAALRA